MQKLLKTKRIYFKELDDEINNIDTNIFQVGDKDLSKKFEKFSSNLQLSNDKNYRTKYKLNPKELDYNFESSDDIILPIKYEYKEDKNENYSESKKESSKKLYEKEKREEIDKELKNEIQEEKNEEQNIDDKMENFDIFGEEKCPMDDEPILDPPISIIDLSDIEYNENEEEELEENDIKRIPSKKNQILITNESSPEENNLQFTEHILNQVKSPLDMLTIGEKVYELINKKDNSKEIIDLSPLNTYKKNNTINVQLFKYINMAGQYNQFIQNAKSSLDDYISKEQKEEVPTSIIIDNRDYKTNCSIWFGTNKAKLIRIPICIKPSKECQGMVIDSEEAGITSMDIFENFLIMGHTDGTIQIWEDQKIIDKIKDIKCEIIQVKFIKINPKKKKYEFIYSDANGTVNYVKRAKIYLMSRNVNEQLTSCKEFPIYKICLFSKEKDLKTIKKKNILICLVSLKNVSLYKIRPKAENQCLAIIGIPYCNIGDFVFDCDFGYGFPPISELDILKEKEKKRKISLIEDILIEENKKEIILFVVSYGIVIRLFEIKLDTNYFDIAEIGHYITDSPVCKLGFITKSYLSIIDNNKTLKIINTFCFENEEYKEIHDPTQNSIINYDNIDLSGYDILKQNNIFFNNLTDGKRCGANTNFLGSVLIFEQNIFIITKQKFLLYKLNRWDEVISNLCQNEEYKKMLWLTTFLLGKNKNLLSIEIEKNDVEECEHSLQESLYIFLIKGTSEENNYKELRMFIEYCLKTERFKDLYKAKDTLAKRKLDNYLYEYITEYIFNGNFSKVEFDVNFLKDYMNYYLKKHEIILLSKILLKLNVNNLNKLEILKILEEKEIINPFIYAKMKEREGTKCDYFKPIEYLFKLFENKLKENENHKNDKNKEDGEYKKVKEEYYKLMTEHDMKYYYDKTLSCCDYIGHKLLWYINKCLNNEEYPRDNSLPNEAFEETCKKIFLFLTLDNIMEILLKFDSFSYFKLLTKLFTDNKINRIMILNIDKKIYPYAGLESFIKKYGNISIEYLSEKYFYYQIKIFIDEKTKNYKNNYYILYDFYQMTSLICDKRKSNNFIFIDRVTIINAIKYFINYEYLLEESKSNNYYDPFDCHKIPKKTEVFYKEFSENIENNILYLLQSLQTNQDFFDNDLNELFLLEGLKNHNKIKIYLSEYGGKFEELFKLKLEEYYKYNPAITKEKKINNLFKWINDTLKLSKEIDSKSKKRKYHENFKLFLKTKLIELSKISIEHTYNLIEKWFNNELKDICFSLDSDELKCAYLNKYLILQNSQKQKDVNYDDYLMMKLELLIKNNHKEQIIKLVENNKYLWDNKYLEYLTKNEVFDAAVFINQKRDNTENCVKLTVAQINKILYSIKSSFFNYKDNMNFDIILIKLEEIKKFLDLGLNACASWTEANKNYTMFDIKNTWLKPLDLFYEFKNELNKDINNNQLYIKKHSNFFNLMLQKFEQNLLENIEYILSKMTDYIPLSLIVEVLCDKFKKSKFKEYSNMFQRMFSSARRTEDIYKTIINLWFDSILNDQKYLLTVSKKGLYSYINKCNYCGKQITENENAQYFGCRHIYHTFCCPIEKGKYACYICRMKDSEESTYSDIPKLFFRKKDNVNIEKMNEKNKSEKEKKEKNVKKTKLLEKLKKITKKKHNKFENFKTNIENIDIQIKI